MNTCTRPENFETKPSGTYRRLTETVDALDNSVERLTRERHLMMQLLHYSEADLARALDIYERAECA